MLLPMILFLAALTLAILTLPGHIHAADTDIIGKARVIDGDTLFRTRGLGVRDEEFFSRLRIRKVSPSSS